MNRLCSLSRTRTHLATEIVGGLPISIGETAMSEKDVLDRTSAPLTVSLLTEKLRACGLAEGQTVLVHLAMSKLGWIVGANG